MEVPKCPPVVFCQGIPDTGPLISEWYKGVNDKRGALNNIEEIQELPPVKRNLYWSKRSGVLPILLKKMQERSLQQPESKRSVYWSKRSAQFPTLPFSTIVRNGKQKRAQFFPSSLMI